MLLSRATATLTVLLAVTGVAHPVDGAPPGVCEPTWYDDFRAPVFGTSIYDLAEFEGSIYAAGPSAGGRSDASLARWDGLTWSAIEVAVEYSGWSPYAVQRVETIDDGSGPCLYATGRGIWRIDDDGVTPLASEVDGTVYSVAWFDGKLFAGGLIHSIDGQLFDDLACWDGASWSWPGGFFTGGYIRDLAIFDDGAGPALYAAGGFDGGVARWDGVTWTTHVGGGLSDVYCLEVHDDGNGPRLYAGGVFTVATGAPADRVAVLDHGTWLSVGDGPGVLYTIRDLASVARPAGAELYAGGGSGVLLRWDGVIWETIAGADGSLRTLLPVETETDATLYVGGSFAEIDGTMTMRIAAWDGDGTAFRDVGSSDFGNAPNDEVYDFVVFAPGGVGRPDIYAAGNFTSVANKAACGVARFDGRRWFPVGDGEDGCANHPFAGYRTLAVFDEGDGDALFVGGYFHEIAGLSTSHIARWDGVSWTDVGGGVDYTVEDLVVYEDATGSFLVAVGGFDTAGGVPVNGVARWDGETWSAFGSGVSGTARVAAVYDAGDGPMLYIGGEFQDPVGNVRRWNGTTWDDVSTSPVSVVRDFETFDDGTGPGLYASASDLLRYDGSSWSWVSDTAGDIARIESNGVAYLALVEGNYQQPDDIKLYDGRTWMELDGGDLNYIWGIYGDPIDGALWVGGRFQRAGPDNVTSPYVARWGCPICLADLGRDGSVGWADLMSMLQTWGSCETCREDLDEDGVVGFGDLMQLLASWGPCR